MKLYAIYTKKNQRKSSKDDFVAIKEGFLFKAFIFNIVWMLYHKLWRESSIVIGCFAVLIILSNKNLINTAPYFALKLGILLFIGMNAKDWYQKALLKRGYKLLSYSFGKNEEEAHLRVAEKVWEKTITTTPTN